MATLADPRAADTTAPPPTAPLRLGSFADAIREHPALDHATLQWLVHKSGENGLDAHIYDRPDDKRGPPWIDLNGFAAWMRQRRRAA